MNVTVHQTHEHECRVVVEGLNYGQPYVVVRCDGFSLHLFGMGEDSAQRAHALGVALIGAAAEVRTLVRIKAGDNAPTEAPVDVPELTAADL